MAIKYVRATGGSDANDGLSFANGWATLAYAFYSLNPNRIARGDTLAICGDILNNVFSLTSSLNLQVLVDPLRTTPVYFVGYNMLGIPLTNSNFVKITTSTPLLNGLI